MKTCTIDIDYFEALGFGRTPTSAETPPFDAALVTAPIEPPEERSSRTAAALAMNSPGRGAQHGDAR